MQELIVIIILSALSLLSNLPLFVFQEGRIKTPLELFLNNSLEFSILIFLSGTNVLLLFMFLFNYFLWCGKKNVSFPQTGRDMECVKA